MRQDIGTWRDGALVAKPKDSQMPDPLDPEWKMIVYIRNCYNRVVPVAKWLAYDMIQNRKAEMSTKEEYLKYEEEYWKNEAEGRSNSVKISYKPMNEKKYPDIIPDISKEEKKDEVLEVVLSLNNKFDKLTDAILQLASSKIIKAKKKEKK